jgi:glutamate racemase
MRDAAIGIFDSGIGGLTVAREIARRLPHESLEYLGDTARLPYGSKSPETVTRYARKCVQFLQSEPIKAIVVACNTASALALPHLESELDVPILGVVGAGARAAAAGTRGGTIGVIGQEGTVRSGSYVRAIRALRPGARIVSHPCPLLVPLAEEGWIDNDVARRTVEVYLEPLAAARVDSLVLGCTHYPLFKPLISASFRERWELDVALVDSAEAVTDELQALLAERGLLRAPDDGHPVTRRFFCTDAPERFERVGLRFFGEPFDSVGLVDI